jgi:hypothetical protein
MVLDNTHTIMINGVTCSTLGHELKGKNIEHPYFGTNKIVDDIKKMRGWG